jgi:hypothetical protein
MAASLDDVKAALAAAAAQNAVPANARAAIGDAALASQRVRLSEPYYSACSFEFAAAQPGGAGTAITYSLAQGKQATAFAYGLNNNPAAGGFAAFAAAGINAGLDMTNIREPGKPNAGETVLVYGISVQPWEDSDAWLAKLIWTNVSCFRLMNGGKQRVEMGRLSLMPGAGGLQGTGRSFVVQPASNRTTDFEPGALSNGLTGRDNFYTFAEPWYWRPAGNTDTDLNIVFNVERPIAWTTTPVAANTPAGGFNLAYAPPAPPLTGAPLGTYVRFSVLLWSLQDSGRSVNQ